VLPCALRVIVSSSVTQMTSTVASLPGIGDALWSIAAWASADPSQRGDGS
jgi:hypothetical protein